MLLSQRQGSRKKQKQEFSQWSDLVKLKKKKNLNGKYENDDELTNISLRILGCRYNELSQKIRFQSVPIAALCIYNIQRENLVFKISLCTTNEEKQPSFYFFCHFIPKFEMIAKRFDILLNSSFTHLFIILETLYLFIRRLTKEPYKSCVVTEKKPCLLPPPPPTRNSWGKNYGNLKNVIGGKNCNIYFKDIYSYLFQTVVRQN